MCVNKSQFVPLIFEPPCITVFSHKRLVTVLIKQILNILFLLANLRADTLFVIRYKDYANDMTKNFREELAIPLRFKFFRLNKQKA